MQGAAQTANAPPSSTVEPPFAHLLHEPRRKGPLGPRAAARERKADHDEGESGDLGLRLLRDDARDRSGAGAESDEDDREAENERRAREHDPPPRPALAEPVDLDCRHCREVAGHEWQDTGRHDGDEPGEERDRELLKHGSRRFSRLTHRTERARRRPAGRARGRARPLRGPAAGRPTRGCCDQYQAPPPAPASADSRSRRNGRTQASRSKPCVCGTPRMPRRRDCLAARQARPRSGSSSHRRRCHD